MHPPSLTGEVQHKRHGAEMKALGSIIASEDAVDKSKYVNHLLHWGCNGPGTWLAEYEA